jgi:hypothetical protein
MRKYEDAFDWEVPERKGLSWHFVLAMVIGAGVLAYELFYRLGTLGHP